MTDVSSELSSNPGRILKTARKELNYSIDQVADELHLRSSVVEAMELENYDSFSSDVFLKGYFRSYCRLVNLHEERMVELLDAQLATRQQEIDTVALNIRKRKQQKARKKFITVLLLGMAIAALALFIATYVFDTDIDNHENQASPADQSVVSGNSDTDRADADAKLPVLESGPVEQPVESSEASDTNDADPVDQGSESPQSDNQSDSAVATDHDMTEAMPAPSSEEIVQTEVAPTVAPEDVTPLADGQALLEVNFSGDCWFKLVDANNKTVYAALKRANDVVSYSGLAPFRIVLGDASKAQLSFNGSAVNLQPFTARNGRAAFKLGEDV